MEPEALSGGTGTRPVANVAVEVQLPERDFAAAYEAHYRDVYRYVLALTRSHADAEDTCAETFERAYREWTRQAMVPGRALPWLLLTARRIATDRWRRTKRFARLLHGRAWVTGGPRWDEADTAGGLYIVEPSSGAAAGTASPKPQSRK